MLVTVPDAADEAALEREMAQKVTLTAQVV